MTDDTVFVDDESGAAADEPLLVKDAVSSDHLTLDIREKRECDAYVLLEPLISSVAVNANAQNLRVALLKVGDTSLIRLQLLRSTARKGEHVKSQGHVLF